MLFQVYEVLVPTDDDKFVRQALHMFAQFATEIRCSPEDLVKERGAVLEVSLSVLFAISCCCLLTRLSTPDCSAATRHRAAMCLVLRDQQLAAVLRSCGHIATCDAAYYPDVK